VELEFGNVGFYGGRKTGGPGENPVGARTRTNNKLNPHMIPGPGVERGHIGGRRVLSPLRHPCSHKIDENTTTPTPSSVNIDTVPVRRPKVSTKHKPENSSWRQL